MSVIITTHNRARLLGRAIDSVLAQTLPDYELIVVDDGSTDETAQVLAAYRPDQLQGIRIPQPRGANHARQTGARRAAGELLAFLDDDDIWLPRKLEAQVEWFRRYPDAALVGCWFRKGGEVVAPPAEVPYRVLLSVNLVGGFSMCMFTRRSFEAAGGLDEGLRNSQDWDLWLRLAQRGRVLTVPECLMEYEIGNIGRISDRRDRTAYYESYQRVVGRHWSRMGFWTRQYHSGCVAYHTAPPRTLQKWAQGARYWLVRTIDGLLWRRVLRRTGSPVRPG